MDDQTRVAQFGSGLGVCWASLLLLPVGLLAIGGGPCAGPRNALGSAILLGIGLGNLIAVVYGAGQVIRGVRGVENLMRSFGAVSICVAAIGALVGGLYMLMGYLSLASFLRY